jgi:hypothetical protein
MNRVRRCFKGIARGTGMAGGRGKGERRTDQNCCDPAPRHQGSANKQSRTGDPQGTKARLLQYGAGGIEGGTFAAHLVRFEAEPAGHRHQYRAYQCLCPAPLRRRSEE